MFAWMLGRRRALLLLLTLARPGSAWVLFDGKRLEQAVPRGQAAKNGSDILSPAETVRLVLDDNFPGAFRWSARPAIRYAISPDFCDAMKGTMIEEDGWLRRLSDALPLRRAIELVGDGLQEANLWMGDGGMVSALHLDGMDNMLMQLQGLAPGPNPHASPSPSRKPRP